MLRVAFTVTGDTAESGEFSNSKMNRYLLQHFLRSESIVITCETHREKIPDPQNVDVQKNSTQVLPRGFEG